ncbi:hypothetical protein [Actinokineospora globicatena]|uniref:hypothetical protein n=1 Tax=Actinokineospora globicatena TaxID=103729 RepID=UPI0020A5BC31|nr:hypothetical protein [Actinokineospora globicatena]MCP2302399.1 hypothetical protein [Actinokineospora globicatena]GLW75926.1 hypothetical protein Aglo01_04080 [Actinokineospora globicatena]GLW82766.1 hypothetical protein Aglo02_04060 [Actinokineospora globicatena]
MSGDELADRYARLRRAAAALLEVTAVAEVSVVHQRKLDGLAAALAESGAAGATTRELVDPSLHLLCSRNYQGGAPDGAPRPFAGEAQGIRESLALDDATEEPPGEWPDVWDPALTEVQAMVVGTLLRELAARLVATGDPGGRELAVVVGELADEVLAPTFVGAQR